jgi:hypothetical protein
MLLHLPYLNLNVFKRAVEIHDKVCKVHSYLKASNRNKISRIYEDPRKKSKIMVIYSYKPMSKFEVFRMIMGFHVEPKLLKTPQKIDL